MGVEPLAFARISPKAWVGRAGNALVCTTDHVENLCGLSADQNAALFGLVQRVAVAMRSVYDCEGISIRQHNEPAGDQDLWHVHVHVFRGTRVKSCTAHMTRPTGSRPSSGPSGRIGSGLN